MKALVARGADVNYKSLDACEYNTTPLIAASKRFFNTEVARWLVKQGADIEAYDSHSKNFFTLRCTLARSRTSQVFSAREKGMAPDYIVDRPEFREYGLTPLHVAAQHNSLRALKWLRTQGADLFKTTQDGYSALSFSTKEHYIPDDYPSNGHRDTIDYLLTQGLSINNSKNAMHYAAQSTDLDLVKKFVAQGGDIHSRNNEFKHTFALGCLWRSAIQYKSQVL